MEKVFYTRIETPIGTVWAAMTKKGLIQVHADGNKQDFLKELKRRVPGDHIEDPTLFYSLEMKLLEWGKGKPKIMLPAKGKKIITCNLRKED